jgi:hypothetical protein
MKQFKGNPKAFNALADEKRIKVLTESLMQFGSNAKVLEGNARSLTGEFQRLKDSIFGIFSVLRPIGDVLTRFILPTFHKLNNFLQSQGEVIMRNVAMLFDGLIKDPKSLYVTLKQLQGAQKDLNLAGKIGLTIAAFQGLWWALGLLGVRATVTSFAISGLSLALNTLKLGFLGIGRGLMLLTGSTTVIGAIGAGLNGLVMVLSRALWPVAVLMGLFQLIRRAIAIARADDAIAFANALGRITQAFLHFKNVIFIVLGPLLDLFDFLATKLSVVFRFSHWMEGLIWLIELAANTLMLAFATIQGVIWGIMQVVQNLMALIKGEGSLNLFKGVGDSFNAGIDEMIASTMDKLNNAEGGVSSTVNNFHGGIHISNNFKEQLEPDRIAFTLKEQLMKTAQNPSQSSARSLSGAVVGR